jgi:hypothetical protein
MAIWAPPVAAPSAVYGRLVRPAERRDPKHVTVTKEIGDKARARTLVQALRFIALHHPAAVQDRNATAHGQGFLLIMGDIEKCRAGLLVNVGELDLHGPANLLVERGKRLIEQKHARRRRQRASQRHPLLLAAAEIGYALVGEAGEADKVDHLGDAPADLRTRHPADFEAVPYIFRDVHVGEHGILLEHHAEVASPGRHPRDILSVNLDSPRIRGDQAGDHAQDRRFPRSARTEEGEELPAADGQRQPVGGHCPSEPLRQTIELEDGVGHMAKSAYGPFRIAAAIASSSARTAVASSIDAVSARWWSSRTPSSLIRRRRSATWLGR